MAGLATFLFIYLFGGITFIPLIVAAVIYFGTRPVPTTAEATSADKDAVAADDAARRETDGLLERDSRVYDDIVVPGDDVATLEKVRKEHVRDRVAREQRRGNAGGAGTDTEWRRKQHRQHDPTDDFATAGYFAVFRKYVALGVNAKPVEPGTVGPTTVAPPSPSVYQTLFRSMLNKKPGPETVEVSNAASPRPKNARNMFYVVLRHGHLILFDDDQQVDVRHVIKLADHDVGVDSGSGKTATPEGELFIKRTAVRLTPKKQVRAWAEAQAKAQAEVQAQSQSHGGPLWPTPQPWFFFCENCSDKEDFYFALLRSQENAPQPLDIDVRHLTGLMERLHSSAEAAEMRWLNALVGRLFLGVHRTPEVLRFVQAKVVTKLSRTPRPGFVSSLSVQRVDIGEATPQITSPRLKSLTAEGECIVEADVRYAGRFEIDVAATIRVSTPISTQMVRTSLAVVFTRLDGHMLFKIKAPPSNRVWFSFRHMPKIDMEIRPIVMARQLTWPVFLQMIESRLKEAIAESIVLPFWDDMPFFSTEHKLWRGGVWEDPPESRDGSDKVEAEAEAEGRGEAIKTDKAESGKTASGISPGGDDANNNGNENGNDENASPAVMRLRRLSRNYSTQTLSAGQERGGKEDGPGKKKKNKKKDAKQHSTTNSLDAVGEGLTKSPLAGRAARTDSPKMSASNLIPAPSAEALSGDGPSTSTMSKGLKHSATAMSWLSSRTASTARGRNSSMSSVESGRAAGGSNEADATGKAKESTIESADDGGHGDRASQRSRTNSAHSAHSTAESSARVSAASLSVPGDAATDLVDTADDGTPARRTAVLAAAMTGAAATAKRWGINALQRRNMAVEQRKARAELERRMSSSGEPIDLSKPMGGGLPLPPPGEPLPMPRDLVGGSGSASGSSTSIGHNGAHNTGHSVPRKPVPPARRATNESQQHLQHLSHESSGHESSGHMSEDGGGNWQRRAVGRERTPSLQPQDMIMVVEAPVESDSDGEQEQEQGHGLIETQKDEAADSIGGLATDADDDAQWGAMAESVVTAFMEGHNIVHSTEAEQGSDDVLPAAALAPDADEAEAEATDSKALAVDLLA